jgi:hypothetical protein
MTIPLVVTPGYAPGRGIRDIVNGSWASVPVSVLERM